MSDHDLRTEVGRSVTPFLVVAATIFVTKSHFLEVDHHLHDELQTCDSLLTLPDEVQYVWKGRWSRVTVLWLFTKYFTFVDGVIIPLARKPYSLR